MKPTDNLILETSRLWIKPLSYAQLLLYIQPGNVLEKSLGLEPYPRTLPQELAEALEQFIIPAVGASVDNYLFSTLWSMIDKEKKRLVGDICFKGPPNEQGELEIGYGTYADFAGSGFMTEALGGIIQWALSQSKVTSILAETAEVNLPSHKTLLRNNFIVFKQVELMIWWRLDKDNPFK